MRRLAVAIAVLLSVAGAFAAHVDSKPASFRVEAVFDTAKGMVPGQTVKIAGVAVGKVRDVRIVPGPKALLSLEIEGRFAPFHADATCRILPEGLITENYVEC